MMSPLNKLGQLGGRALSRTVPRHVLSIRRLWRNSSRPFQLCARERRSPSSLLVAASRSRPLAASSATLIAGSSPISSLRVSSEPDHRPHGSSENCSDFLDGRLRLRPDFSTISDLAGTNAVVQEFSYSY